MGNRGSSISRSIKTCGLGCKRYFVRKLVQSSSKRMVQHAESLIKALKLGPLKVKLDSQRVKVINNVVIESANSEPVFNYNTNSDTSVDDIEDLTILNVSKPQKKTESQAKNKFLPKAKKDFKIVDLFLFKKSSGTSSFKASRLLAKAISCHTVVERLKMKIKDLLERNLKNPDETNLKESPSIITVGTKMHGEIRIPQESFSEDSEEEEDNRRSNLDPNFSELQQSEMRPYQLTILREIDDEAGNTLWIGRHQTYDGRRDKQTILLQESLMQEGGIHFEDYETHCDGVLEGSDRVVGSVKQLKKGRPGFFIPTRREKFTFSLERDEESKFERVNQLKSKLFRARFARALSFGAWAGVADGNRVTGEKFPGHDIDWSEVIEDMVWICDEVGTLMRRYVSLLDGLSFPNASTRKKMLASLEEKGVRRASIHEVWDAATILLTRLRTQVPSGSIHSTNSLAAANNFADKVVARLEPLYTRFDQAMRRADVRVCTELKKSWEQVFEPTITPKLDAKSFSSSQRGETKFEELMPIARRRKKTGKSEATSLGVGEDEVMCIICTTGFEKNEGMYVTPCKHAFHIDCLDEWFQQASVCPTCREDFSNL